MEKLTCVKKVVKPVVAFTCIVAVLFAYIVPVGAAGKQIKLDKIISSQLANGETKTYTIKVSQKTKVKFTANAQVASEDDWELDEYDDDTDDTDDVEDIQLDESDTDDFFFDDTDNIEIGDIEYDDISDDISDDFLEDDYDIDIDEDLEEDSTPVTDEYVMIAIKKGIKNTLAPIKIRDGKSKSSSLVLKPGKYTITVKAVAADTINYSFMLQDKAKYASKISTAAKKTVKKGSNSKIKVKGNGTFNNLTYTSTNKKVAKVDKNGRIKAISKGTCKIKVKMKGIKKVAVCKITVK